MKLNIAHLYPDLLNMYGDKGNIVTLTHRCLWRNIGVEVYNLSLEDNIDPEKYDFYFIGGGQDQQQIAVANRLMQVGVQLHKAVSNGAVILAICGGYQLLGHYYQPFNSDKLPGISLLDAYTIAGNKRFIGNVTIELDDSLDIKRNSAGTNDQYYFDSCKTLVGFENHSGLTYLGKDTTPLGKIIVGNGNNGIDLKEGAVYKTAYGTYLHGSLLPKNPHFADLLIVQSLARRYGKVELQPIDDYIEFQSHEKAVNRKY